ncbi:asparagine--tRNA ligase [Desulfonatronovibrio hydrogenovorans]|uniref:asparagine--tRNA ligase n=1 Tax=Desulfonatronovibrio hydrogenovorans TaxID=53245 RepID=UPI000551BD24|nr:asparagine--tRNA ligase [Desulfonatronovibrio hydrogenovorans]
MRIRVKQALNSPETRSNIQVKGWVRTKRQSKGFCFLEVNDGSCLKNLQVIVDQGVPGYEFIDQVNTGASVDISGDLVSSPGKGQAWEVKASMIALVGGADPESYPLQKKRHSDEFLRTIAHLRPRTNKYGAMNRIRSEMSFGVHKYFHDLGFNYIHTPIVTGSDCEGAGEMFLVTALDLDDLAAKGKRVDFEIDFFGKRAHLTVSGQLNAENLACALGDVYTFGPTFRAENSNTPKHVAEFWMIEPEMAFADLKDNMDLAEDMVKKMLIHVRENCPDDLELFTRFVDKDLESRLDNIINKAFVRLPYVQAIDILNQSGQQFEFPVEYGLDLQTEHERFLCEQHFKAPVILFDYPKTIKPFYMRVNDDDQTVAAMDVLVPGVGELVGGSQREERQDVLESRIDETGLNRDDYWWYIDLRRFGTVPHSGFGLGFERLLMLATGVTNIRDVIMFPRTPKGLEF